MGISRSSYYYKSQIQTKKVLQNLKRNSVTKFLKDIGVSTDYPNKKDIKNGQPMYILTLSYGYIQVVSRS